MYSTHISRFNPRAEACIVNENAPVRFDVVTFAGEDLERVHVIPDAFEVSDPWR